MELVPLDLSLFTATTEKKAALETQGKVDHSALGLPGVPCPVIGASFITIFS